MSESVLVIGAGVVGAAIADALAARGAVVSVLDMRSPGRGASQASAGALVPYIEAHEDTPLLALGTRSLAMYDAFVDRLVSRTRLPIEYGRSGSLDVALTERDESALHATKAWLDARGVRHQWLAGAALASFEPAVTAGAPCGLFVADHGFVGVSSLVKALVQSARLAGATFEAPVEAVAVTPARDRVDVQAGERSYVADQVVIAAGSWSRRVRVAGVEGPPVRPIRGQLLHLRWPGPDRPSRIVWSSRCYAVPWSDGSLLVGATVEDVGFDESSTVAGVRDLTTAVAELLPNASAAPVDAVRVGLRPASPDGLPIIGPIARAPRVMLATGHYRNGVLLAPLTATIVADALLDARSDPVLAITSPDRFARA
ncbi:MAG TPA: glycine oxidase ThiO [Vicinamibacterales bacterium]|nr:glycine oxidase ThiO [Vicinamibacterales bacterium]